MYHVIYNGPAYHGIEIFLYMVSIWFLVSSGSDDELDGLEV